jgi:membrane associated rhomboid family serine protease
LRSVERWLDRFCNHHPRLGIPNLMTFIVAGTALVYLLNMFSGAGYSLYSLFAFSSAAIFEGQLWRLITFIFVPLSGDPFSLILSLYFYWWIGSSLEREWGTAKFTIFYGMGVLLSIILGLVLGLLFGNASITITYVNLSLFFAFATLYPDLRVLLFFIVPVKVKWLAWVDAALFLWGVVSSLLGMNWVGAFIPVVAILNYFLFFWSDITGFIKTRARRVKQQNSRQTTNFKSAVRKAQEQKGYIHKCAVCGKTDADYPDEEFRYCSKCNGYYCYCSEHLGNHVHIE